MSAVAASFDSHSLTVHSGNQSKTLSDVLFGDVWTCGGQSNMEYSVNGSNGEVIKHPPVNDSLTEITRMADPEYEHIRFIRAGHQTSSVPMLELLPPHAGGSTPSVPGWTTPCPMVNGKKTCRGDFSSMCWFYGRNIFTALAAAGKPRPLGLIESCWSGSPDEQWSPSESLAKCLDPTKGEPKNGGMFNGMIRPLLNTTIKGAIWYQGESDAEHPGGKYDGYNCTFPAMIEGWRSHYHEGSDGETAADFPFGLVQLNSIGNGTVYNNPRYISHRSCCGSLPPLQLHMIECHCAGNLSCTVTLVIRFLLCLGTLV
jgi:sialate O-acetylesterase